MRKEGLVNRLVGQGAFACVYSTPNPKEVLKLTTCKANVEYMMAAQTFVRQGDRHFPLLVRYGGVVGYDSDENSDIHALWVERLKPVRINNLRAYELLQRLEEVNSVSELRDLAKEGKRLFGLSRTMSLALHRTCDILEMMGGDNDVTVDFHDANFMMRPGTRELVIVDPITAEF